MAVLSGTKNSFANVRLPAGPVFDGTGRDVRCADIGFSIAGTYSQSDQAQLLAVPTFISDQAHEGRAVTLLSASFVAPGDENGTAIGAGPTITVSGANLTFPLTGSDLATQHTGALLATVGRDIFVSVTYAVAAI